jgi:hypothetical protein
MVFTLRLLGFKGCLADPDIWMRPANKPYGTPYCEYVLIYVTGILELSHDPKAIMDSLEKHYTVKAGSVKAPDKYLGVQIQTHTIDPGLDPHTCWAMLCDRYVKRAVEEVQRTLEETGQQLHTKVKTHLYPKDTYQNLMHRLNLV